MVGSYALQALGGLRASASRVGEDAAERPPVTEAERTARALAVVQGVPGPQRPFGRAIAETATS